MGSKVYCFDRYRIDPKRHEFWNGGEQVTLQLKVFEVMVYLLQHRDRAVCRDELISAVWGRVDVSDKLLNQIVGRVRQAVGDSGDQQHTISTVPHFGYRWNREVEEIEVDLTKNGNRRSRLFPLPWRKAAYGLALLAVLLLIGAVVIFRPGPADDDPGHLAHGETALVLPVAVVGENNESWIRLGIMDLIADRLREAGQAVVPSDNAVALAQSLNSNGEAAPGEIAQLARTATAAMVMRPRAERINGHWRVSLQTVHGFETPLIASGEDQNILIAARAAADRLTMMLGHAIAIDSDTLDPDLDHLLQQVRAAVLSDHFDQARILLDGVDDGYRSDPRVRYQSAHIDLQAGRLPEAEAAYAALAQDVPPTADPLMHARALHGLGRTTQRRLDYAAAESVYTEAVPILQSLDSFEARNVLGLVLMGRTEVREIQGNIPGARADRAHARVAFESTGDQLALARLDGNLAISFIRQARYAESIPHAQRALERIHAFGDVQSELRIRVVLATAKTALLDAPGALAQAMHFDPLLKRIDNPVLAESVENYHINILLINGHLQAADALLRRQLERETSPSEERGVWGHPPELVAADQALERGQPEAAARYAETVIQQRPIDRAVISHKAIAWTILFRAHLQMERIETATEIAARALSWAENSEDNPLIKHFMILLRAEHAVALGDAETARDHFEAARAQAEARAVPLELLRVAKPYVTWLIAQDDLQQASVVMDSVAGWAGQYYDAAVLQLRLYHALGDPTAWRLALNRAQALVGERQIPADLLAMPGIPASPVPSLAAMEAPNRTGELQAE